MPQVGFAIDEKPLGTLKANMLITGRQGANQKSGTLNFHVISILILSLILFNLTSKYLNLI
jgi:hypothetical protein